MMRLVGKGASTIPFSTRSSQVPQHGPVASGQEVLHLLLCIDKGETLTRLHQERLHEINGDKELFSSLRKWYSEHRKLSSWLTLRSVKSLSLARVRHTF